MGNGTQIIMIFMARAGKAVGENTNSGGEGNGTQIIMILWGLGDIERRLL
jgi:hypothetical protein